jgi:Kef-type K+ transport system membrane component KefB
MHDETAAGPVAPIALALFLGVAMSITAFPVLARILTDRGMHRTPIGVLALACAAVDDIIAWTLLAFVVAVVQGNGPLDVLRIVLLTAVFAAVMFGVVRPLLKRLNDWYRRVGRLTPDILSVVLIGVLASAFVTEMIGIHAIFGAFVFGAVMPRRDAADLTHEILERLEQVSVLLLLPLFFVVTGLSTNILGLTGGGLWQLALILLVAIGGKFAGAYAGARAMKVRSRQATALGLLMNTRGLTELVILNVGKQLGVLDDELFTMLVLMALITTAMTGPLLKRVYSDRVMQREIAEAERAALGVTDAYRVLVLVDDPERARELAVVGAAMLGRGRPAQLVLTRLLARPTAPLEVGAPLVPDLARMAATVDELNALARELRDGGVASTVLTRFSVDPWADLIAQAAGVEADVVLVTDSFVGSAGAVPPEDPAFTLAIARLGDRPVIAGASVGVVADGGADGRVAIVLGSAVAAQLTGTLHVAVPDGGRTARRVSSALGPLRSGGLDVRLVDATDEALASDLVLLAGGGAFAADLVATRGVGTVVRVHAGLDDRESELAEQLAKLAETP